MTVNLNLHFKVFHLTQTSFQIFLVPIFLVQIFKLALHLSGGQTLSD